LLGKFLELLFIKDGKAHAVIRAPVHPVLSSRYTRRQMDDRINRILRQAIIGRQMVKAILCFALPVVTANKNKVDIFLRNSYKVFRFGDYLQNTNVENFKLSFT